MQHLMLYRQETLIRETEKWTITGRCKSTSLQSVVGHNSVNAGFPQGGRQPAGCCTRCILHGLTTEQMNGLFNGNGLPWGVPTQGRFQDGRTFTATISSVASYAPLEPGLVQIEGHLSAVSIAMPTQENAVAALLAAQLPGATRLQLAFTGSSSLSPGTAKTTLESLSMGGRVRIDGRITRVPLAWKTREVPFAEGSKTVVTVPWGDVASAYYSTGIGNIEVYTTIPPEQLRLLRRWGWLLPLLRWGPLRRYVERWVMRNTRGPTAGDRASGWASFWGRVEDDAGQKPPMQR